MQHIALTEAWRIFRLDRTGLPATLFHGHEEQGKRTRTLPLDRVVEAEVKLVYNPGKRNSGTQPFLSGWHVCKTKSEAEAYLSRFKDHSDLRVCRVEVAELREKPRATSDVLLARWIKVNSKDWSEANA